MAAVRDSQSQRLTDVATLPTAPGQTVLIDGCRSSASLNMGKHIRSVAAILWGSCVNFRKVFKGKVHQNVFDGLALPRTTGELTMLD